jgi:hypothetical protein
MNGKRRLISGMAALLLVVFVAVPLTGLAQGDDPATAAGENLVCNPAVQTLADQMGVDCQVLLDLQQQGLGLGEIMKAWALSQSLPGFSGTWQDLLRQKEAGTGWGQLKMAYQLADGNISAEALLALKNSGVGWGQIKQAQALAATGLISFDEVLQLIQSGLGWGDIRDQLGLPPGPPPWAGGGINQNNGSQGQGPPPWANNDKDKGNGPPGQNQPE